MSPAAIAEHDGRGVDLREGALNLIARRIAALDWVKVASPIWEDGENQGIRMSFRRKR